MAKISELGSITGANTRSEDLFVIVNLVQGDDGTKNITRKELVQAIQYEVFNRITITGGTISGVVMRDSRLDNVVIDNSDIEDTSFIRGNIDNTTITNSTANNITITSSSFSQGTLDDVDGTNVRLVDSTIDNSAIANSSFTEGTVSNTAISTSTFTDGDVLDSRVANTAITTSTFADGDVSNTTITTSTITDSTANNVVITQSQFNDGTANNSTITQSVFDNGQLTNSTGENLDIANSDIDDSRITNSTANNVAITSSTFTSGDIFDSNANNVIITNSEFNDGTGNNVVLTNSTIDDSLFTDGTISNTSFTGTMDNVVATDMTIRSSSADGLSSNNSSFENGTVSGSVFDGGTITNSKLVDFDMELNNEFEPPIDDESYFAIRNEKTGETEQISFGALYDEVSKKTAQALKVHVDAGSGDDSNPGTQLQPVQTLERAFELCLEKAGGDLNRNAVNNAVHISAGPGTYYTKGNLALPDDCSMTSTAGQYATVIEALPGYENNNAVLVGSGCYVQGFSYQNWKIDNFDYPEGGFAIAYRPGAKLLRSPYLRDSTQLSNFLRQDVEPPLNPFNSKGTLADLGQQFFLEPGHSGTFAEDDEIKFSSGAVGYVSYVDELATADEIYVRNLKNGQGFAVGDTITSESGGTGVIQSIGIDDFPNREVGRGGGCVLADRRVLDPDSLYTYVLCFGFTPRTQNGIGYVARDGAGVNGIGSLSIFVRIAFYALNGGQMTLNNSGTQFGDISMRAKGSTNVFQPRNTTATIIGNTAFADTIDAQADTIIDDMVDYLSANTAQGGLDYTFYDADKCERDSGIILDGVGYDIALDTNYWSRLAGITYRSPISSKVIGEQLDATLGANQYLQSRVENIFAGAGSDINERANTSFQELYNVVEYGEENMNPIIWRDTSVPYVAARELIQDNRAFITDELIDWIENNDEFYAYDSVACRRDIQDYILPAVQNDMLYDTNYNSVTAGRAYYMATAKKVIQQQNNETVAAYKRLKDQTNELIDGDSYLASQRLDDGYDEIIKILENSDTQFTPINATYDAETGKSVITLGSGHGITKGSKILLKTGGLIFTCDRDNNTSRTGYPRASDPAAGTPIEVIGANATSITVYVGASAIVDDHTFVEALPNSVSKLGSEITWSDSTSIDANKRNARKQLQANKEFIQEHMLGYIDYNYFRYDSDKCRRDVTQYILPAVERDILTGTNYNAIQTGLAYRSGTTLADNVINEQLVETTGAIEELRDLVANTEIGSTFTPTDASYDPTTGQFTAVIGEHSLEPGDYVSFLEGAVTFSCDTGSGPTNDSVPVAGHPFYNHPCQIESVTRNSITMNVGTGGSNEHTFVSALTDGIREVIGLSDNASEFRSNESFNEILNIMNDRNKTYSTSNATYDPASGLTVLTIGNHDFQVGDQILIAPDSLTFTCALDGNATQHTYPTTTISTFTPTGATYDPATGVFTATIGAHKLQIGDLVEIAPESITFTCDLDGNVTQHAYPEPHHPFYKKKIALTGVTSTTITMNVGAAINGGGTHTFVSALANSIEGERRHPAYKAPVTISATASSTITVNVGPSSDTSTHTFVSATADNIKPAEYTSTYTPTDATYDPATGVFVATIGEGHNLVAGDYVMLKPESVVFTCVLDGNATEHAVPEKHHPFYRTPVKLDSVTNNTITMNVGAGPGGAHTFIRAEKGAIDSDAIVFTDPASYVSHYTPTTATYDPATGISVVTIPGHDLTTNDYIEFAPYSFTYTCAQDGNATEHSYPRKGDSNYRTPMLITNVAGDDITVQLATSSGGAHTFVSVEKHAVSKVTYNSQGQYAREQLQDNREFLQEEVASFLRGQYFVYDGDKCSRDTGYILDAVRRDVATGSNYPSVFMGLGYQIGTKGSNEVVTDQLTQTVGAINYLKGEIGTELTGTALARANAGFDEIIDIMNNGSGNANALQFGTTAAPSANHTVARTALQLNRDFIIAEVTAYIAQEFPTLTYDIAKCERDTGYLVDAISWDIQYGSNAGSINFARLYYENAISVLPEDQKLPTAKTWEHIAEVAYQIVRDQAVTKTSGNAETQDVSQTDAGIVVGNAVRDGINITTQIIRDDNLDNLPAYVEPTNPEFGQEVDIIDGYTENLQSSVIDFLADEYNGLAYDENVCKRDVGLLVDAVSRDIEYGGNENTLEALDYYFRRFDSESADYEQLRSVNVLPIEVKGQFRTLSDYDDNANVSGLREKINVLPYEQREATRLAFGHLADVAEKVVKEVAHTTTYNTFTPTNATYDPATGVFTVTVGSHDLVPGDQVWLKDNAFTFSCDMGSGAANHTSPQAHHPYYQKPVTITAVTPTVLTMNVGTGGSGQQPHTFVSALANSVSEGPYQSTDGTPADATTGTAVHDLFNIIAELVDDTNIETAQLPTLTKASFDPNRTLARKQLQRNRDFIIEEVQAYIKDRYYTFDGDKCKRDIGLILDAVKADVLTGSNFNAVFNGLAYRIGTTGADAVINEQLTETVSAIKYAKGLAVAAVTDTNAKTRTEAAFDEIIDIMTNGSGNADTITYTGTASINNRINARAQLQNNKAFLQAEITAWLAANRPSLTYDVAKCERDLGYLIDAISFDAQHQGNFATINDAKLYFENAVSVLPEDQREPTAAAFAHIGDCAELVVQDTDIGGLKSAGNGVSQDFSSASAGAAMGAEVEGLFDIVANAISNNTLLLTPPVSFPTLSTYDDEYVAAFGEIESVKETVQNGVLAHLAKYFEVLPYNEAKCRRDTGYIVDAVSHDIQYGGNSATVQTAGMYFENAVNTGLQIEQRMGSRDAFLHMAKIVEHVVGGKAITTTEFPRFKTYYTGDILTQYDYWNGLHSYQTTEEQDFHVHGANPKTSIAARALVEIVANAVDDNKEVDATIPDMIGVDQSWMADNYVTSKEALEKQKVTLSENVISYLSNVQNGLSFKNAKCRRDIGYLVDAISHDIQHDTNFAIRQSAGIYFENGISVLPVDTRNQTADIYNYLGTLVSDVVQEIDAANTVYSIYPQDTSGTPATAVEGARVSELIGYVEDVIRNDSLAGLPGLEQANTAWIDSELTSAQITLDDNSEELATDVTEFINSNFNVLDYNKDKCRRDTGYLLDAFSFDLNFGGNTASRWNADFYFWNSVYRLPEDQRIPTAKSYRQLGRICKDIVLGKYEGQVVLGDVATEIESKKVQGLADIFYKTQLYNDTKYLPVKQEPDYTYSDAGAVDAQGVLSSNRAALAMDTVRYVGSTYKYIDEKLTRRDARNLLTAIQNDFKYEDVSVPAPSYTTNGNQNATKTYTAAFFDFNGKHVFPVFNPSNPDLKYQGSVQGPVSNGNLAALTGMKPNHAYIVADDMNVSYYEGDIYYWDGSAWQLDGPNNTDLLDSFTGAWDRMRDYIVNNLSPNSEHTIMLEGLFNDCLKGNVLRPNTLVFGSLVESIAHQFNGAGAGVNRNALPLNFRNLGGAVSAVASVLNEDGGRIRWSGADELNNQYFARGLRINGRTGRIEGRPFTSSVRKLARRASNSRAQL